MISKFPVMDVSLSAVSLMGFRRERLPWLQQVRDREQDAKQDTYSSYDNVCDAQERVATTHDSTCADDNRLGALVHGGREP